MNRKAVVIAVFCALFLVGIYTFAQQSGETEQQTQQSTPQNPEGLDTIVIDKIVNLYEAVVFTHSNHVNYAENCATCHHYSGNETPPCYACHSTSLKQETTDTIPNLKAAYHRQCMGCHKSMGSGPMGCTECHAKRKQEPTKGSEEKK